MDIPPQEELVSSTYKSLPKSNLRRFVLSALFVLGMVIVAGTLTTAVLKVCDDFDSNADVMYLPALYHDLATGVPIRTWLVPAVAGFFPDMPLMFGILWITGEKIILSCVIYSVAVVFLLGAATVYLIGGVVKLRWWNVLLVYAVLLLWFLIILIGRNGSYLLSFFLMPSFHSGTIIAGILFLALTMRLFRRPVSKITAILWVITASISIASDSFFLVQFFVPIVICMYFLRRRAIFPEGPTLVAIIKLVICASVVEIALMAVARRIFSLGSDFVGNLEVQVTNLISLFSSIFGVFSPLIIANPVTSLVVLSCILAVIVVLAFYLYSYYRAYLSGKSASFPIHRYKMSFCMLFFLISVLATLLFPILTNYSRRQMTSNGIRYFQPLYIFPAIITPVFLSSLLANHYYRIIRTVVISSVILGCLCLVAIMGGDMLPKHPCAKPDLVKFFDHLHEATGLTNGLGSYWVSKPTCLLSEKGMHVDAIWYPWGLYPHTSNTRWYLDPNRNGTKKIRKYEFIVPHDKLPEMFIIAKFGFPARVYEDPSVTIEPSSGIFEGPVVRALIYNRKSDVAFRNYLYIPVLTYNGMGAPSNILYPQNLQEYKPEGLPSDSKNCSILSLNQGIKVEFSPPAEGDILEISADYNDVYQADVQYTDGRSETLRVPAQPGMGLARRILSLNNAEGTSSVQSVTIKPISGDGNYSVGHVFVYYDNW